jgi:hypothetical protein
LSNAILGNNIEIDSHQADRGSNAIDSLTATALEC